MSRPLQSPREHLKLRHELGRLVNVEVDAEHRDAEGKPFDVVVRDS